MMIPPPGREKIFPLVERQREDPLGRDGVEAERDEMEARPSVVLDARYFGAEEDTPGLIEDGFEGALVGTGGLHDDTARSRACAVAGQESGVSPSDTPVYSPPSRDKSAGKG